MVEFKGKMYKCLKENRWNVVIILLVEFFFNFK